MKRSFWFRGVLVLVVVGGFACSSSTDNDDADSAVGDSVTDVTEDSGAEDTVEEDSAAEVESDAEEDASQQCEPVEQQASDVAIPFKYVLEDGELAFEATCAPADAPIELEVAGQKWTITEEWCDVAPKLHLVTFRFTEPEQFASKDVVVRFPRYDSALSYLPALTERTAQDVTTFDVAEMPLYDTGMCAIPVANGLLGLGQDKWLIKVQAAVHLSARIMKDNEIVEFRNEAQSREPFQWSFLFADGIDASEAIELARQINVDPTVVIR